MIQLTKKGRKFGDITNTYGSLLGAGVKTDHTSKVRNSPRGFYYLEFSKRYRGVTELDIDLRYNYAIELIANHTGIAEDFLHLKTKKSTITETSLDSVYYVHQGSHIIGKMSISIRRYGNINELLFIYQVKELYSRQPKQQRVRRKGSKNAKARAYAKTARKITREKKTT